MTDIESAPQGEIVGKHLGAFNVHVSSTAQGQIVLEFMEGSDPVPFMKGVLTVSAALQVSHLLFDRVKQVAAEQDEQFRGDAGRLTSRIVWRVTCVRQIASVNPASA